MDIFKNNNYIKKDNEVKEYYSIKTMGEDLKENYDEDEFSDDLDLLDLDN